MKRSRAKLRTSSVPFPWISTPRPFQSRSRSSYSPVAPSALSAQATAYNSVTLRWTDDADNEQGFKVERSGNGGSTWTQIYTAALANVTTFVDNTVQGATG